jgi:hypothetical protein
VNTAVHGVGSAENVEHKQLCIFKLLGLCMNWFFRLILLHLLTADICFNHLHLNLHSICTWTVHEAAFQNGCIQALL